jgi:uncharacterized protein involved in exopolysaccharide biosynthesis
MNNEKFSFSLNNSQANLESNSISDSVRYKTNWQIYLPLGLITNGVVWSIALLYLKLTSPSYTSEWAISIPSAKSSVNVTLPGIGEASSSSDSPFNKETSDPRENYKFIAETDEVIEAAANQLKIPKNKFGKPRIGTIANTTLMKFEIKGDTPIEAQQKALALHKALTAKLDALRKEELAQQDQQLKGTLSTSEKKLHEAQQRLSNYKGQAGLSGSEQLRDQSVNLESLRRQRAEILAQMQQTGARLEQLSASLGLSAQQAADALTLQSDQLFQKYLADYTDTSTQLSQSSARFTSAAPAVIAKKTQQDIAQAALVQHAESLLKRPVTLESLKRLVLDGSNSSSQRAILLQELISLQEQQQGLQTQAQELERQTSLLESRLATFTQKDSKLAALQRDVQIAEAVFSSTLTRLDLSQSNISASYPSIAMVKKPDLPTKPTTPKKTFVLLGAAMGSFFCTTGVLSLLLVDRKIQQAKHNAKQKAEQQAEKSEQNHHSYTFSSVPKEK